MLQGSNPEGRELEVWPLSPSWGEMETVDLIVAHPTFSSVIWALKHMWNIESRGTDWLYTNAVLRAMHFQNDQHNSNDSALFFKHGMVS